MKKNSKVLNLVMLALFVAIIFILAFTPIGYIQTPIIKATILHIPVIIGSIFFGPKKGAFLGAVFGLTSLISNTIAPTALSFAFSPAVPLPGTQTGNFLSLIICFIPRILVGVIPYFVFVLFQKIMKNKTKGEIVSLAVAGAVGSFANTIFVMGLIFLFFKDAYATLKGIPVDAVIGTILTVVGVNGVPEAIAAVVLTAAIGKALLALRRRGSLA
jgi:uncharacterized membrane protein